MKRYIELVLVTAVRALKARYRGSILGVFWSLSNPLLMTAVYSLIFGTAFSGYYGSLTSYILACFTGLAVLNFFSMTTSQALPSIVASGSLLNKIPVPPSIFPLSVAAANVFQNCVGVVPLLLVVTVVVSHRIEHIVGLLVPAFALLLVTTGFSLVTSSLFVYFRDLPYVWELVVFVVWITSPVFYPAALVPAAIRPYINLNPIAAIMSTFRQLALSSTGTDHGMMVVSLVVGFASLGLGVLTYRLVWPELMDLV